MMHRFADASGERTIGHDPKQLAVVLGALRMSGVALLDLDQAVEIYANTDDRRRSLPPSVVFTVDDGYADFADVGLPVFEEFDCPVTGFVVADVIDGKRWFWWDQVEWALRHAAGRRLELELDGQPVVLSWVTESERAVQQHTLVERLKGVGDVSRDDFIDQLACIADVPVTGDVPPAFRVLSWNALRSCERRGARFGPHTMSHPILSQCTDSRSHDEVVDSSARVLGELGNPSRVFCYPNGRMQDFGGREFRTLRSTGMMAAVSAMPGIIRPGTLGADADAIWRIPRFTYDARDGVTSRLLFL
ncbi:MAG: polysaccharide deacetylase family protein [Gemmatimonadota bacterium]|nr:polysaccharide deacetylase family protein [Gemmatimonadota bacterium]